jgi:hypothetical protein
MLKGGDTVIPIGFGTMAGMTVSADGKTATINVVRNTTSSPSINIPFNADGATVTGTNASGAAFNAATDWSYDNAARTVTMTGTRMSSIANREAGQTWTFNLHMSGETYRVIFNITAS